jgi:hypothetical protein
MANEKANNRGLKNRAPLSTTADNKLLEDLRKLSFDTKVPLSKLIDMGIELVLKEYGRVPSNKKD